MAAYEEIIFLSILPQEGGLHNRIILPDKGAWTVKALSTPLFDSTAFFSICYDILASVE